MSTEALGRVPLGDWLLAVAVLVCGIVAIAATWRGTRTIVLSADSGDGGLGDAYEPQLALPSGPSNVAPILDDVDRALWDLIESEYAGVTRGEPRRDDVPVPARRELAA